MTLNYASKTSERIFEVYVGQDSFSKKSAVTGEVISSTDKRDSIIMLVLVILVAVNIFWFVYVKKLKK